MKWKTKASTRAAGAKMAGRVNQNHVLECEAAPDRFAGLATETSSAAS